MDWIKLLKETLQMEKIYCHELKLKHPLPLYFPVIICLIQIMSGFNFKRENISVNKFNIFNYTIKKNHGRYHNVSVPWLRVEFSPIKVRSLDFNVYLLC